MKRTVLKRSPVFIWMLAVVTMVFFYRTVMYGLVPFPGDLLLSEYKPWSAYPFDGYDIGAVPSKAQYFDVLRQMLPWRIFSNVQLAEGRLPLWNPYNGSGMPLLANHQSAVLYPLNVLYLILPLPVAWTVLVMAQPFLAALFMLLYLRHIGISRVGSLIGGIAYGFSLTMTVFLEYGIIGHTVLWIPLGFLAVEYLSSNLSARWWGVLTVSVVSILLAGHLQAAGAAVGVLMVYAFWKTGSVQPSHRFRTVTVIAVSLTSALLLASIQLIPTLELLTLSARASHPPEVLRERLLLSPFDLLRFAIPDVFGNPASRNYRLTDSYPSKSLGAGCIPFILAALSLQLFRKKRPVRFFAILLTCFLVLTVRNPLSELLWQVPVLASGSPGNILFIVPLTVAVLAGFGFDRLRDSNRVIKGLLYPIGAIGTLAIVAVIAGWPLHLRSLALPVLVTSMAVVVMALPGTFFRQVRSGILVTLTVVELFYYFQKFNPFVPPTYLYPKTSVTEWLGTHAGIHRTWGYGTAAIPANTQTAIGIFSPEGYDPLYPKWYGEFMGSAVDGKLVRSFTDANRSDAVIANGFGAHGFSGNPYRRRILDFLGVRYILDRTENGSTAETFPPDRFQPVYDVDDWKIYENLRAYPRAFLAGALRQYHKPEEFESMFFAETFRPEEIVLTPDPVEFHADTPVTDDESVIITGYSPGRIDLETRANDRRILVLTDTYYPGWIADIDGMETTVFRAYHAFRGVILPAGQHTVVFRYHPSGLVWGLRLGIMGLVLGTAAMAVMWYAAKHSERTYL